MMIFFGSKTTQGRKYNNDFFPKYFLLKSTNRLIQWVIKKLEALRGI